jgi:hypothetical protein
MFENLGIYNSQAKSEYDINKDIEQGAQFKQLSQNIYAANEHNFLQESSAPEWGSVADACNSDDSIQKKGILEGMTMTKNQVQFNNLVSQYAGSHKAYTSAILRKKPNDASRKAAEKALLIRKNNVLSAANQLNRDIKNNTATRAELNNASTNTQTNMRKNWSNLTAAQKKLLTMNYDDTNAIAAIEATGLNTTSMYYHLFVYLTIAATLLAFVFNFMVNPNASVVNTTFVLVALFAVYIISKYFVL